MSKYINPQAGMTAIHTPSSGGPPDTVTITGNDHGRVYFTDRNGVKGGDYECCFEVVEVPKKEELAAGQWWLRDDGKVMLIAFDERTIGSECSCPIIAYIKPDCGEWYAVKRFVRRLPDDAGFDWKPAPIPEIEFDPKTFTSDWGPFPEQPSNQQLFEMIANLRDQMDRMNKKTSPEVHANKIPVRLWGIRNNLNSRGMAILCCPADVASPDGSADWVEIKLDPQLNITSSGFYIEGSRSQQ